jgi:hypothetical protein
VPADEPTWFYDLHPVGRQLLSDHGDVSALLATSLAKREGDSIGFPRYQDVEEVEFWIDGKAQAEADLVAYSQDVLMVAECKSVNHLSKDGGRARAEVRKKCQVVEWLRADELLFATTAQAWSPTTRTVIEKTVRGYGWGPLGPPRVCLVTDLGAAAGPQMERL